MLFSAHKAIEDIFSQEEFKTKGIKVYKDSHEYIIPERASYFRIS